MLIEVIKKKDSSEEIFWLWSSTIEQIWSSLESSVLRADLNSADRDYLCHSRSIVIISVVKIAASLSFLLDFPILEVML